MRKPLATLGLAAVFAGTSCIGPNNAFNSLTSWNSRVTDSKWLNELIFLGLHIIPVYELFLLGDRLIFNSIEFWGGGNPLSPAQPYSSQGEL